MIAKLRGTIHRLGIGQATVDVQGVGYLVSFPPDVWEQLQEGDEQTIWISTYIKEDRFELYGFLDSGSRSLFELLIGQPGIGPKLGLELCAVPRELLLQAVEENDVALLKTVKGIGTKTAEKLLVELRAITEKQPGMFGGGSRNDTRAHTYDQDAIAALRSLGYDQPTILSALKTLPDDVHTTEERVTAALRNL